MSKPAVSKLYHVRAFEVATDRVYEFDVQGLNNLPAALSKHAGIGEIGAVGWQCRLPPLRNSLSYHNGRHGVVSMGPFRLYVERDEKDAPHQFTAQLELFAGHEPDDWESGAVYSARYMPFPFRELVDRVVADVELHLKECTTLKPREFAGWVRGRVYNGYPDSKLYFSAAGKKYTAHLKVARHDTRAV